MRNSLHRTVPVSLRTPHMVVSTVCIWSYCSQGASDYSYGFSCFCLGIVISVYRRNVIHAVDQRVVIYKHTLINNVIVWRLKDDLQ